MLLFMLWRPAAFNHKADIQFAGVQENDRAMTFLRISSILFSALALGLMFALIVATCFSLDAGFLRHAIESHKYPWWILAPLGLAAMLAILVSILALYRGVKKWRARSWLKDGRVMTGVELKFEAAVFIGLGFTVSYKFLRLSI